MKALREYHRWPLRRAGFFLPPEALAPGTSLHRTRDGRLGPGWALFRDPVWTASAFRLEEVWPLLQEAERQRGLGRTVSLAIAYDAAPAFDPALVALRDPEAPLVVAAAYEGPGEWYRCLTPSPAAPLDLRPEWDFADYEAAFARVRDHLRAGDTYQVNLSYRREGTAASLAPAFLHLAEPETPLYGAYLNFEGVEIASLSPELFFRQSGDRVIGRPMKGTRPRDTDPAVLLASEKDRAENLMIVDMIRNDLGRVATPGSVRVDDLFSLEAHPTVWQMTSTVSAQTFAPVGELLRALFPCASVVGAPKVETTRILADLEPSPRGFYCGAIGLMLRGGGAQFNVAIRTLWRVGDRVRYGVGSGVVWDSTAEAEWQECEDKARVLSSERVPFALLETFRSGQHEKRHRRRLLRTAKRLGISVDRSALKKAVREAGQGRVRVLASASGVQVAVSPLDDRSWVKFRVAEGAPVHSRDPLLRIKTTWREPYWLAEAETALHEPLLVNERGELTEFGRGNVVAVLKSGRIVAAHRGSGNLPGVGLGVESWMGQRRLFPRDRVAVLFLNSLRGFVGTEEA